jgi:murein DD-endopeptidase
MRARAVLLLGVAWIVGGTGLALMRGQEAIELRAMIEPRPVTIEGREQVVYELHLTNRGTEPVRVERLDVLAGAAGATVVSYAGSELRSRLAIVGATDAKSDAIAADGRAVIYLEVQRPAAASALRHRITYVSSGSQAGARTAEGADVRVSSEAAAVLSAPLRGGPWAAVHSPLWERGHRRVFYAVDGRERIPGRFAIDWIKLDAEGRSTRGEADLVANALGYGEDVLAVADATVAAARDDVDEVTRISARRKHAPQDASGNYVALDLGGGRFVFYEHLKPGSVRVKAGLRVRRGDVVASLGFTGDSTGPHLHLHVADGASPLGAEGLPFALDRFEVLGAYDDVADLGKKRWSAATARPDRRQRERPAPNVVIDFGAAK